MAVSTLGIRITVNNIAILCLVLGASHDPPVLRMTERLKPLSLSLHLSVVSNRG